MKRLQIRRYLDLGDTWSEESIEKKNPKIKRRQEKEDDTS